MKNMAFETEFRHKMPLYPLDGKQYFSCAFKIISDRYSGKLLMILVLEHLSKTI